MRARSKSRIGAPPTTLLISFAWMTTEAGRWRDRRLDALARRMVREPDRRPSSLQHFSTPIFHADGVHCGTDKQAPACHSIDPANIRSLA